MRLKIRRAEPADVPELVRLDGYSYFAAGWNEKNFTEALAQSSYRIFLAQEKEKILGFICCTLVPPQVQVLDLAVSPNHLRRGIGAKLLIAAVTEAYRCGCDTATLEVNELNSSGLAFYDSAGFTPVGRRPKFYHGRETAILMDLKFVNGA